MIACHLLLKPGLQPEGGWGDQRPLAIGKDAGYNEWARVVELVFWMLDKCWRIAKEGAFAEEVWGNTLYWFVLIVSIHTDSSFGCFFF
jgi:hypothetical protein